MPSAIRNARQALGKAAGKCEEPWEVRPGAHYSMGGIRVDANGASVAGDAEGTIEQGIKGLFAAGQAMGGVFGANRLGSTSLTEAAVFGNRAGRTAARLARENSKKVSDDVFTPLIDNVTKRFGQQGEIAASTLKLQLQEECWHCIGPVRTADRAS